MEQQGMHSMYYEYVLFPVHKLCILPCDAEFTDFALEALLRRFPGIPPTLMKLVILRTGVKSILAVAMVLLKYVWWCDD